MPAIMFGESESPRAKCKEKRVSTQKRMQRWGGERGRERDCLMCLNVHKRCLKRSQAAPLRTPLPFVKSINFLQVCLIALCYLELERPWQRHGGTGKQEVHRRVLPKESCRAHANVYIKWDKIRDAWTSKPVSHSYSAHTHINFHYRLMVQRMSL
jgi:hypothetical protein